MLYIVPTLGELDAGPVTNNAFQLSTKTVTCENCQESMPAYLLSIHTDICTGGIDKDVEVSGFLLIILYARYSHTQGLCLDLNCTRT